MESPNIRHTYSKNWRRSDSATPVNSDFEGRKSRLHSKISPPDSTTETASYTQTNHLIKIYNKRQSGSAVKYWPNTKTKTTLAAYKVHRMKRLEIHYWLCVLLWLWQQACLHDHQPAWSPADNTRQHQQWQSRNGNNVTRIRSHPQLHCCNTTPI